MTEASLCFCISGAMCVSCCHGDGGGCGRAGGEAPMSVGGGKAERSGGVLGQGAAVTVYLPQHLDQRRRGSGDLPTVRQVRH